MLFAYYRRLFLEGNNSIYWGGETTNRYWDDSTLLLYFVIVFFVIIIGNIIRNKQLIIIRYPETRISNKYKFINSQLRVLFAILIFFIGFRHTTVGVDTISYSNPIEDTESLSELLNNSTTEPLFKFLQYLFHIIFNNGTIGILIYSIITLTLIYKGIKNEEQNISLFISLIVYVCIYYFPTFNLLRISLASGIIFYYFHYLIEGEYIKFSLIILIASLIHFSSLMFFFPLGIYLLYKHNRILAITSVCAIATFIIFGSIILGDYLAIINRYSSYIDNNESDGSVGLMLFIDYFPCIIICLFLIKNRIRNVWSDLMICFSLCAIIIRLMAYFISIAGRLHLHFMLLTMILLPYWVLYFKRNKSHLYKPIMIVCLLWCIFKLHIYFSGYLSSDGIMPYRFFWE